MSVVRIFLGIVFFAAAPRVAQAFELDLPLACEIGKDCWIQQYANHSAGKEVQDYQCGGETYSGHDGTDIRVLNTKSDVGVVAAAPGFVVAARDGVEDRLANTPELLRAVIKQECGNGVVVSHEGGYQTQYCHMRRGSIAVKVGDAVKTGSPLGKVGYSGAAAFAHLHLSLRHGGVKLDPFSGPLVSQCGAGGSSFWSAAAQKSLAYHSSDLLEFGWANRKLDLNSLENGETPTGAQPEASWPALVVYLRAINLKLGDELHLSLSGPEGIVAQQTLQLDHDKAEYVFSVGKVASDGNWKRGDYHGQLSIVRNKTMVFDQQISTTMN